MTPAQEAVVVELRRRLAPLDDLVAVVKAFIEPQASRSGIHRCLTRHGVNNLRTLRQEARRPTHKPFKAYEPGFIHIDVKYLPERPLEAKRRFLFVAIDRASRWVFVRIKPNKSARSAAAFLKALYKACPIKIRKILTENKVSPKAHIGAADVKARRAGRSQNAVSAQANIGTADVKPAHAGGRSQNAVSAKANVSAANVKPRSGGRSHNGKEFTDRLFGRLARTEIGRHEGALLCEAQVSSTD